LCRKGVNRGDRADHRDHAREREAVDAELNELLAFRPAWWARPDIVRHALLSREAPDVIGFGNVTVMPASFAQQGRPGSTGKPKSMIRGLAPFTTFEEASTDGKQCCFGVI
jgi:hypothetical protein